MSFALFGAAMVLVAFLVANVALSVGVLAIARWMTAGTRAWPAGRRSGALLALRLVPTAGSATLAFGLVLPAYLLLEPAGAGERLSAPVAVLSVLALALLASGLLRGGRALSATAALVRGWRAREEEVRLPQVPFPASRVEDRSPVFAVVGLRRPRIYVSAGVLDVLTPAELAAGSAHEIAHLAAGDNLKRLIVRSCPDLLAFCAAGRALGDEWARAAEECADDRAAAGGVEAALALAAGLVKVARLAPPPAAPLPVSALHDGGDIEARVRRLLRGDGVRADARRGLAAPMLLTATAVLGALAIVDALPTVHRLIESMARFLG